MSIRLAVLGPFCFRTSSSLSFIYTLIRHIDGNDDEYHDNDVDLRNITQSLESAYIIREFTTYFFEHFLTCQTVDGGLDRFVITLKMADNTDHTILYNTIQYNTIQYNTVKLF